MYILCGGERLTGPYMTAARSNLCGHINMCNVKTNSKDYDYDEILIIYLDMENIINYLL